MSAQLVEWACFALMLLVPLVALFVGPWMVDKGDRS